MNDIWFFLSDAFGILALLIVLYMICNRKS